MVGNPASCSLREPCCIPGVVSIVIPAHDERQVIDRCLASILRDAEPGEFEIVVACNGCTDDTAERARTHGPDVRVLVIEEASKPAALNAGDQAATRFPRLFVDADIEMDTDAVRRTAAALRDGSALAAAPRLRVDLGGCTRAVRAYYRAWTAQEYVARGLVGSGVYGLSEEGRGRFSVFPDIIADDLFVRCHFAAEERLSVLGAEFVVRPPRTVRALVHNKTRVFAGNAQLAARFPGLRVDAAGESQGIARLAREHPRLIPSLVVYAVVQGTAKARGRRALRRGSLAWRRDQTARA